MFTGLIERVGTVRRFTRSVKGAALELSAGPEPFELAGGDSVAVDGVCLTVTAAEVGIFSVELSEESLSRSTLKEVKVGSRVNLERALRLGDRLGGHLVTGHVDAVGKIVETRPEGGFAWIAVSAPPEVMELVVEKGSIALDGVSLTVNAIEADRFSLMVIPETIARTTIGVKRPGDRVNLETDLIGKYVARLMGRSRPGDERLLRKLREEGFL